MGQVAYASSAPAMIEEATEAGTTYTPPPAVLRAALEADPDPELSRVLRFARERGLPSRYSADGLTFGMFTPIHLDHLGEAIGLGSVVDRVGDVFTFVGWLHPDHAAAARQRGYVSPGLHVDAARIEDDVLAVSKSFLPEVTFTAYPALAGTTLTIGPPRTVPASEWHVLSRGCEAFGGLAFGADPTLDRVTIAYPTAFEIVRGSD